MSRHGSWHVSRSQRVVISRVREGERGREATNTSRPVVTSDLPIRGASSAPVQLDATLAWDARGIFAVDRRGGTPSDKKISRDRVALR